MSQNGTPKAGRKPPLFFYSAKTQFSNAGDALINRELTRLLRARGKIVAISGAAPSNFIAEIGLNDDELISGKEVKLILEAIRARLMGRIVYLVQTPGDIGAGGSVVPALVRAVLAPVLAILGIRIIHVGASLSETSRFKLTLLAWRSIFLQGLGLRDHRSLETAADSRFRNFCYFPDLAFGAGFSPRSLKEEKEKHKNGIRIALSFRGDKFSSRQREDLISVIRKSLAKIPEVSSVKIVVQVDMDLTFSRQILEGLADWEPELVHTLSIEALRVIYSEADVILTNRLHALLLAALSGAAPIAMVDALRNKKVVGLLEGLGLADLVCDVSDSEFLEKFIARIDDVRGRFAEAAREEHRKIVSTFDSIISNSAQS